MNQQDHFKVDGQPSTEQQNPAEQANTTEQPPISDTQHQAGEGVETKQFKFKGRVLNSESDIQQALDYAAKQEERLGRMAGELGFLREKTARLEGLTEGLKPQLSQKEEETDWEKEFFESPQETLKKVRSSAIDEAKKLIEKEKKELLARQVSSEAHKRIWDEFYDKNPHLSEFRGDLVPSIVNNLAPRINSLPTDEALAIVAEEANKRILQITRSLGKGNGGNGQSYSEPGTRNMQPPQGIPKDPTLEQLQKEQIQSIKALNKRIQPSYAAEIKNS